MCRQNDMLALPIGGRAAMLSFGCELRRDAGTRLHYAADPFNCTYVELIRSDNCNSECDRIKIFFCRSVQESTVPLLPRCEILVPR